MDLGNDLDAMRASWLAALAVLACGNGEGDRLRIAAYTAPREAFEEGVIPAFEREWRRRTGREVNVEASYLGSGAQVAAVKRGFPADVVVLAHGGDVERLVDAGLVDAGWDAGDGTVARTLVVIATRPANPRGVRDFGDLARAGIEVVAANPRTSGAAMWTLLALYGSTAPEAAIDRIRRVFGNAVVLDKGARESLVTFERGIGDAALTYEQEVHVARLAGREMDYVIPPVTMLVEIPAAVVERDGRPPREVAAAFVAFLHAPEGQRLLGEWGFRPATGPVEVAGDPRYPPPGRLLTIDDFGGWRQAMARFFEGDAPLLRAAEHGAAP